MQEYAEEERMQALAERQNCRGEKVKFISLQHIPLASAYLCPNCSCIGNSSKQCPACASPFLLSLASVLDRESAVDSQLGYARVQAIAA
jgi:hypothetical protein